MLNRRSTGLCLFLLSIGLLLGDLTGLSTAIHAQNCKGACYLRMRAVSAAVQPLNKPSARPVQRTAVSTQLLSAGAPGTVADMATRAVRRTAASLNMVATVGWNGRYRASGAWVPVRVAVTNLGRLPLTGALSIATPSVLDPMENRPARDAVYEVDILLLANVTRNVTLYVPGHAVPDRMTVTLQVGKNTVASDTLFPTPIDDQDLTVGVLTGDAAAMAWVGRVKLPGSKTDVIRLTPTEFDPVPQALAAFDVIVVTNVNCALLDKSQLTALERYVRSGGALVTVGGPDWQETLRPLPSTLVPGTLRGSTTVSSLRGLEFYESGLPSRGPTVVSVLSRPIGSVISGLGGTPLVVRSVLGVGRIEYLAFDPAVNPLARWPASGPLLTRLLTGVAPDAMRRLALPSGFNLLSFRDPGPARLDATRSVISTPPPILPPVPMGILIFLLLLAAYVALLGPLSFLVLRRLGRLNAAWLTAPLTGLFICGLIVALASDRSHPTAVVGTVTAVVLDGTGSSYPADSYLRVLSLGPGTRTVNLDPGSLAAAVPAVYSTPPMGGERTKIRWVLREGTHAESILPSLPTWSSRFLDVQSVYRLDGGLVANLHVDARGEIVGSIRNTTSMPFIHPAVVAGQTYQRLPDVAPGGSARVRLTPRVDVLDNHYRQALYDLYGQPSGSDAPRIRDAVMMLPEANLISMLGEVVFAGWTERSLGAVKVDGVQPRRADLNLILKPLSVGFPSGTFTLRPGTLGAYPLDEIPVTPRYACCNPSLQGIFMGSGASATFEFDLPRAGHIYPQSLTLGAFAGGPDTTYTGYAGMPAHTATVYNWHTGRWSDLTFVRGLARVPRPDEAISTTGALLVRIRASDNSGDLAIFDPHHDLQLSGRLTVR